MIIAEVVKVLLTLDQEKTLETEEFGARYDIPKEVVRYDEETDTYVI